MIYQIVGMWVLLECMPTTLMLPFVQQLYLIFESQSDLKYIDRWLKANKLSLNVAETEFMVISSRQKLQSLNDYKMNIHINQSNPSKSLTLTMDENLSWKYHVHEISKKSIL